jgi:regulator of sigma E protease
VTTILAFIFVLGVLIFVHELGHFLMARRIGVRVLTFSLGFGPKLLSFRRGDTEYAVSAIPLGGYVKMAGENPEDARSGASDEFLSKSKWQRFQVLIMGPVMNLALAVVVMTFVLHQGADVPAFDAQPVVIGATVPDTPAAQAGIRPGDRIVAFDGNPVPDWEAFSHALLTKANKDVRLTIERDGKRFDESLRIGARGKYSEPVFGGLPAVRATISVINPNSPAAAAGLQRGDVIVGINGERTSDSLRISEAIKASEGKPLTLVIERGGQEHSFEMTPTLMEGLVRVGIQFSQFGEFTTVKPSFVQAIGLSFERNWQWATMILETLAGLFTRDTPVNQLMGPIAIAGLSGEAVAMGWMQLFSLMAMISLNLGLLNLMPVPVLDGGHIAILALEGLSRRDFSMRVKEKMLLAGFVLLLMLMVTVIYNDLTRIQWFQRLMPWR